MKIKWRWFYEPPKRIFTNNKLNRIFYCLVLRYATMTHIITPLLLLFTTSSAASAASASAPVTWFREKYLTQTHNEYYIYTFSRWQLDDNDIDMCPELHRPAVYFAMTGRPLWRESPLTHPTYRKRQRQRQRQRRDRSRAGGGYTQPTTAYDIRWIEITVQDVALFLIDFHLYCCELLILLLSVLMASLTTIILCILVFGQY